METVEVLMSYVNRKLPDIKKGLKEDLVLKEIQNKKVTGQWGTFVYTFDSIFENVDNHNKISCPTRYENGLTKKIEITCNDKEFHGRL